MSKFLGFFLLLSLLIFSACSQPADQPAGESPQATAQENQDAPDDGDLGQADAQETETNTASGPGKYVTLEEYESAKSSYSETDVVLFFNANWCSTCKVARDNIESSLLSIPADLTIVLVDFDTETELRKQYGVVIQHTFVQIDAAGNELARWSGSVTVEAIAEKTV